jgi:uncharacterized protein YndB with AHSA1/START domain
MRQVEATIAVRAAPQSAVWAFTDVGAMRQWWGVERGLVEARVGGVWALTWKRSDQGFKYVVTGRVATLEPDRLVISDYLYFHPDRPVLGPMTLTVSATAAGDSSSVITIRQDGYQEGPHWDWYYDTVCAAWPEVAKLIKRFLEA